MTDAPRLLERLRRRLTLRGDDGTMAMYLLIAMIGMALGSLLMPMVVTSSQVTRSDITRLEAIDAARAGTNAMVGKIRTAQSSAGVGTSTLLPCTTSTPLTGRVNGSGDQTYSVTVSYYMDDPVSTPSATRMTCATGYGTYDPVSNAFTPRYARITAVGHAGNGSNGATGGRTLQSTYVFKSTNSNTSGGPIQINVATGATTRYCMDAGSATPSTGTVLLLQVCSNPVTSAQIFAYRSDLTLLLVSSVTASVPLGMCLDTAAPPNQDNTVVLKPCSALGSPPYTQQWSFNDQGGFTASASNSANDGVPSNSCMSAPSQAAGIVVKLDNCGNGRTDSTTQAWVPAPSVGSGAATSTLAFGTTQQLVNYAEFGRCLDVLSQNVNTSHLIDYPCKQNPSPSAVLWNQKFTTPAQSTVTTAVGHVYTTTNGTQYCLTSPGTAGAYPTMSVCSSTNTSQNWTLYNGSPTIPYSARYQFVDSAGLCLSASAPATNETWSAIDVEACTGSTKQKWNATANITASSITNLTEPGS